jgi:hypothetical protein
MNSSQYTRGLVHKKILLLYNGKERNESYRDILKSLGTEEFVRLPLNDYVTLTETNKIYSHFNLPIPTFCKNVILAKIIQPGYFTIDKNEKLPLISLENVWTAELMDSIKYSSINDLPKRCFLNSIGGINNKEDLKNKLLERYKNSLPDRTDEEILSQGVSVRFFRLIKKVSLNIKEKG